MSVAEAVVETKTSGPSALSQATIFRFFYPLALSWIFMSVEGPLSVALISRLPNAEISTAAFNIMMGLALWVESPVIDLLSTSTTLSKNRQNYRELSRFVWYIIATVTLAHAVLVFTPLFHLITEKVIGLEPRVADEAQIGLALMLPWSALIGWRRYLQGILIRYGRTRLVGIGTAVRVGSMFGTAFALYIGTHLRGVQIAGISLICAVGAEAAFAHWASRRTIRERFTADGEGEPITQRKLRRFHLPLTATTMVMMMGTPAISGALARAPNAILQLAGFQVAATLVWLMRTTVFALPEVVIALYRDERTADELRRFCIRVGVVTSSTLFAIWVLGLDMLFFRKVLGATPGEVQIAHMAFIAPLLVPFIGACQSYVRGMLTAHHFTVSRLLAIGVSMATLMLCLALSVMLGVNGVVAAGVSMTIGLSAELAVLIGFWRRLSRREAYEHR